MLIHIIPPQTKSAHWQAGAVRTASHCNLLSYAIKPYNNHKPNDRPMERWHCHPVASLTSATRPKGAKPNILNEIKKMKLLEILKGHSAKDIRPKQDIAKYLVFPYPLKGGRLWLDKKAVVPENTVLAIATRGRILDILPPGEHKLTTEILPGANAKFKLHKPDKDGKPQTNFKAFAYIVNTSQTHEFPFETYKKIRYDNEIDGKFWAKIDFSITFQISDAKKFLKSLMCEYAYLKTGEAESILRAWLSEFTTTELARISYRRTDFENHANEIETHLATKLTKLLADIGIKQTAFCISDKTLSRPTKHTNPLVQTTGQPAKPETTQSPAEPQHDEITEYAEPSPAELHSIEDITGHAEEIHITNSGQAEKTQLEVSGQAEGLHLENSGYAEEKHLENSGRAEKLYADIEARALMLEEMEARKHNAQPTASDWEGLEKW